MIRSRATAFGVPTSRVAPSRPISPAGRSQVSTSARLTSPRLISSARTAAQTCRLESPTSSMVKSGAGACGGARSSRGDRRIGRSRWRPSAAVRDRAIGETRPAPSVTGSLVPGAAPRTRCQPRPRPRRQPPASPTPSPATSSRSCGRLRLPARTEWPDLAAACARPGWRRGRWRFESAQGRPRRWRVRWWSRPRSAASSESVDSFATGGILAFGDRVSVFFLQLTLLVVVEDW